jgi:hypothetical protein
MLVSTLLDKTRSDLKTMSTKIALAGLAIALMSALLYVPPIIARGPGAVMAKDVSEWQQPEFVAGLKNVAQCASVHWTEGVPHPILWVLLGGFAMGLVLHGKICKDPAPENPLSITLALWIPAVIFVWAHHVFAFPRVWIYLLLSAVMTASTGLSLVPALLVRHSRLGQVVFAGAASIVLAVVTGAGVVRQRVLFTTNETGRIIDADQIVDFLSAELHSGDALLSNAIIQYQLLQKHPQLYHSLAEPEGGVHLIAVVVKSTGKIEVCSAKERPTLMTAQDTADPGRLASEIDLNAYTPPRVLAKFETSTLYSLERKTN